MRCGNCHACEVRWGWEDYEEQRLPYCTINDKRVHDDDECSFTEKQLAEKADALNAVLRAVRRDG